MSRFRTWSKERRLGCSLISSVGSIKIFCFNWINYFKISWLRIIIFYFKMIYVKNWERNFKRTSKSPGFTKLLQNHWSLCVLTLLNGWQERLIIRIELFLTSRETRFLAIIHIQSIECIISSNLRWRSLRNGYKEKRWLLIVYLKWKVGGLKEVLNQSLYLLDGLLQKSRKAFKLWSYF